MGGLIPVHLRVVVDIECLPKIYSWHGYTEYIYAPARYSFGNLPIHVTMPGGGFYLPNKGIANGNHH